MTSSFVFVSRLCWCLCLCLPVFNFFILVSPPLSWQRTRQIKEHFRERQINFFKRMFIGCCSDVCHWRYNMTRSIYMAKQVFGHWEKKRYTCNAFSHWLISCSIIDQIFHATGPFAPGIHRSPVNSPHKGQWRGVLMFLWFVPEQTVE